MQSSCFVSNHPDVPLTVKALHSPQIVSALALQKADVDFLFSPVVHSTSTQEHLADGHMVCIALKGILAARLSKRSTVTLADLLKVPVIGLNVLDPIGRSLNQACR